MHNRKCTPAKILKILFVALIISGLAACATQAPQTQTPQTQTSVTANVPDWVMSPAIENGIADTQCVVANNGGMNYLKSQATTLGRAELAKQIDIRVKAMDKAYQQSADTEEGAAYTGVNESVTKQVTNQNLTGSRAVKMDYVMLPPGETQNFCVMMAMDPETTQKLFKELLNQSGNSSISPRNEAVLYQRFLSDKAAKEMEAALENDR